MHILRHDFEHTYTQDFFNPTATQSTSVTMSLCNSPEFTMTTKIQRFYVRGKSMGLNQQSGGA